MPIAPYAPGRITHSSAHANRNAGSRPNDSRTNTYTPPERGNAAASSEYVSAPHSTTTAPTTQASRKSGTSSTRCATPAGVRKMPLPMVEPTSTATALHRPRRRVRRSPQRSVVGGRGAVMKFVNILKSRSFAPAALRTYVSRPMTRRYTLLAWTAAAATYLLIVLGAVVRITGSGMGCGDHWPLCNGHLFPPLDDIGTVIEWSHRLLAALVSVLVVALAVIPGLSPGVSRVPRAPLVALGLLVLQVALGAMTVKLALPPWTVVLHLGTAMLLLATLLIAASSPGPLSASWRGGTTALIALAFLTVLFGALTANLGAAEACTGFPLCSSEIWPSGGGLALIQWVHRLLAYTLSGYVVWWAVRSRGRGAWAVVALVALQVAVGA